MGRKLILPDRGSVLVSTDLHGNGNDFRALRRLFEEAPDTTHWVILGDAVHAPDSRSRASNAELYDYPDESAQIVTQILALTRTSSGRVHFVLGNHDHGHVGGPHTAKFYADEVSALEDTLSAAEKRDFAALFGGALLCVVAPCGAVLCHGSPDDALERLDDLDAISFLPQDNSDYHRHLLETFLRSYGQPNDVTQRFLGAVSRSGVSATFVLHGHDRDESGWFTEGEHQGCPVLFGAPRANKRYAWLDLGARYRDVNDLCEGEHVRRLYP